ncbi:hypothetical protein GCM10009760_55580 [Kitasatospora kazusensis]|uniref:non-specific serine/threonine protein kinase n=1 Tax=Kitasatospora kazusensis TaxID=407974 RepID=A0ABP5LWT1_9ACTN
MPNYTTHVPGWTNLGPLSADPQKQFVREARQAGESGAEAVLKFRAYKSDHKRGHRFHSEAQQMRELTLQGTAGVLPVLDIDTGAEPAWYVMPRAGMLADVVAEAVTLQQIAGHILVVAQTLAGLAARGIYHRDIKPDNLFWYGGGPVLADFGIAYWAEPGQTAEGEKLGPMWFMAPEMRAMAQEETGRHADVYSLAQTFAVFLHPGRDMPLPGTFRAGTEECHLYDHWLGDPDAVHSLEHLLEAATRYETSDRITIGDFARELDVWLAGSPTPITRNEGLRRGWGPQDEGDRDRAETRRIMIRAAGSLAASVGSPDGAREYRLGDPDGPILLGSYELPQVDPDGFETDGELNFIIVHPGGRRTILCAVFLGREVSFTAEVHRAATDGWELDRQWPLTPWARMRLPSAAQALHALAGQVQQMET